MKCFYSDVGVNDRENGLENLGFKVILNLKLETLNNTVLMHVLSILGKSSSNTRLRNITTI
jgi:hypothetical protein